MKYIVAKKLDQKSFETWEQFDNELYAKELVYQSWRYYSAKTHLDIARVALEIRTFRHTRREVDSLVSMSSDSLVDFTMSDIRSFCSGKKSDGRSYFPCPENDFFATPIEQPMLNGVRLNLFVSDGDRFPTSTGGFSLGRYSSLEVTVHLWPIVYEGIAQQYSDEFLLKFKEQLFDDFLANLTIEYSAEAKAIIEQLEKP